MPSGRWGGTDSGHSQQLLTRHRDADGLLRRDEVIRALGRFADGELHALYRAVERIAARAVVLGDGRTAVLADIAAIVGGEDKRLGHRDRAFADFLAVDIKRHLAALAEAAAGIGKLHAYLVLARRQCPRRLDVVVIHPR